MYFPFLVVIAACSLRPYDKADRLQVGLIIRDAKLIYTSIAQLTDTIIK